jgi:hypothetical protein
MNFSEILSLSPALANALAIVAVLVVILLLSSLLRAKVFCQYLGQMTGIELKPKEVREAFLRNGRDGVRELLLDKTIRADLADGPTSIPDGAK